MAYERIEEKDDSQKYVGYSNMANFASKFFLNEYYTKQKLKQEELARKREMFYKKVYLKFANEENYNQWKRQSDEIHGRSDSGMRDARGRVITHSALKNMSPEQLKTLKSADERSIELAELRGAAQQRGAMNTQLEQWQNPEWQAMIKKKGMQDFRYKMMGNLMEQVVRSSMRGGITQDTKLEVVKLGQKAWTDMDPDKQKAFASQAKAQGFTQPPQSLFVQSFVNSTLPMFQAGSQVQPQEMWGMLNSSMGEVGEEGSFEDFFSNFMNKINTYETESGIQAPPAEAGGDDTTGTPAGPEQESGPGFLSRAFTGLANFFFTEGDPSARDNRIIDLREGSGLREGAASLMKDSIAEEIR